MASKETSILVNNWFMMYFLSVVLIGTLASYFAKYIKEHRWLGWVGIGVIFIVALQLILGGLDSLDVIKINDNFRSLFHV